MSILIGTKKTQKKIVPIEVGRYSARVNPTGNAQQDVAKDKSKRTPPYKGSIIVIRTREGLRIQKERLRVSSQGLKTLVEKLDGLC